MHKHIKKDELTRFRESLWKHLGKGTADYFGVNYNATLRKQIHDYDLFNTLPLIRNEYKRTKNKSWIHSHKQSMLDAKRWRLKWIELGGCIPG